MNGSFLLDTNIIIGLIAQDASVLDALRRAQEILIPSIAIGELFYGAQKSTKRNENLAKI